MPKKFIKATTSWFVRILPHRAVSLCRHVWHFARIRAYRANTTLVVPHSGPVFVLGNQKSGTTVIAVLLARHAGMTITNDMKIEVIEPLYPRVLTGTLSMDQFVKRRSIDFSRDLIKEPNLTLLFPQLEELWPKSRFLFIVRDPRDNIRSLLDRLALPGNQADLSSEQWNAVPDSWKRAIDGSWLGICGHNYIEHIALRWNAFVDVYFNNCDRMVLVRYEDFVREPEATVFTLADQLGLEHLSSISNLVHVQYKERGNRDVNWHDFYGIENHNRIAKICGSRMIRFGYEIGAANDSLE